MPKYLWDHTDYHELPLDYIMKLARESLGIKLKVVGDQLHLVNDLGETLSKVTISYSTKALNDSKGNNITTYLINAGTDGNKLVLTRGNNEIISFEIPYSKVAKEDVTGKDLTSYLHNIAVVGDNLRVTLGDGTTFDIVVPFSIKAATDINSKDITTYAATLETDGDELVLRDSLARELSRFKVKYSDKAKNDIDNDPIKSTYGNKLETGNTTVKLVAKDGTLLSEIVVPYAISCSTDTDGNELLDDYVEKLVVDGQRIGVEAHTGKRLSTITVPFATVSTDATNAVENVEISGDNIVFTTFGGAKFSIISPYSIKSQRDGLNNVISKTYVANVSNNLNTGEITFYDAEGNVIVSLTPQLDKAIHDSYNNLIADYISSILVDPNSDYITVTHGTGDTEALKVNYAVHSWRDSNNNVIKNFYISYLECVEDVDDGHYKLVAYDGDTPRAELFRIPITAYKAQADVNGRELTTYIGNVEADSGHIDIVNGNDEIVGRITAAADVPDITPNTISGWTYNSDDSLLVWQPGTPVVVSEKSVEVHFDNM